MIGYSDATITTSNHLLIIRSKTLLAIAQLQYHNCGNYFVIKLHLIPLINDKKHHPVRPPRRVAAWLVTSAQPQRLLLPGLQEEQADKASATASAPAAAQFSSRPRARPPSRSKFFPCPARLRAPIPGAGFPRLGHGGVGLRGSCGAAAASRGGGGGGPREVPRGVQLRGLAGGRRQPRHRRHPGLPRHRAPALRPDLLRLPHRAVLRRPPRRRFHWYVSRIAGFLCWRVSPF